MGRALKRFLSLVVQSIRQAIVQFPELRVIFIHIISSINYVISAWAEPFNIFLGISAISKQRFYISRQLAWTGIRKLMSVLPGLAIDSWAEPTAGFLGMAAITFSSLVHLESSESVFRSLGSCDIYHQEPGIE